MSEREVMLSGKPYQPWAQELEDDRDRAREQIERYNASKSSDKAQRAGIIASLFGKIDKEHPPHLESPFYCDYVSVTSCFLSYELVTKASPVCLLSIMLPASAQVVGCRDTTCLSARTSTATLHVLCWMAAGSP